MIASFFDLNGQTIKNDPFGTRVHKYVVVFSQRCTSVFDFPRHTFATLHDHLSGWKVDLDILGEENSVVRTVRISEHLD